MQNKDIVKLLKLMASLMELHDENPFKIKSYAVAAYQLDKTNTIISQLSLSQLEQIPNVGKSIAARIDQIIQKHTFDDLQTLLEATPAGVVEMLEIKGIGPKKVRAIWKELAITDADGLIRACKESKLATLKGFGDKIQEEILEYLVFRETCKGKFFYADVASMAHDLERELINWLTDSKVSLAGEVRRKMETVENILFIVGNDDPHRVFLRLEDFNNLTKDIVTSSPYIWRGTLSHTKVKVEIKVFPLTRFASQLYMHSAGSAHLAAVVEEEPYTTFVGEKTIFNILRKENIDTEEAFFEKLGWPNVLPEIREGQFEISAARAGALPVLIKDEDLKGILHNHSTYSDGENTLEEMALYCRDLGYEYLGISDHSKTATYAKGLYENKIMQQHDEIDLLNAKMTPFRIFKGIESDILGDGSLDYEPDVLKTFDFIVASIHSGLKMDVHKATQRLITAIENPYTTTLGHPTGRLLLRRQGYPINHARIIDACAANGVIIEINANPWRLDLDWKWIHYAITKGVMLSINPDAHELTGYHDMHYGVCVARKGGLTSSMCFNAKTVAEVELYFNQRKSKA